MWVKMKGRKLQSRRATAQHARGPRNIAEHREGGGKHLHGDRASGRERRAIGRAVFVAARSKLALCLVNRRKVPSARLDRALSVVRCDLTNRTFLTARRTRQVCRWKKSSFGAHAKDDGLRRRWKVWYPCEEEIQTH